MGIGVSVGVDDSEGLPEGNQRRSLHHTGVGVVAKIPAPATAFLVARVDLVDQVLAVGWRVDAHRGQAVPAPSGCRA